MQGAVDAEVLLGAIDESLGKDGADVDIGKALAATHERRHPENLWFPHPDSTPTIFVCRSLSLKPRVAAHGDVISESFRGVDRERDTLGRQAASGSGRSAGNFCPLHFSAPQVGPGASLQG
jgi:hypothetical protein